MNPIDNHQLRDFVLRKLLEHLILIEENSANPQMKQVEKILDYSLMDCHVYREVKTDKNRFIDLLIVNQQYKYVILIENKFYASLDKIFFLIVLKNLLSNNSRKMSFSMRIQLCRTFYRRSGIPSVNIS